MNRVIYTRYTKLCRLEKKINMISLAIVFGIAIVIYFIIWTSRYAKVGPNEVLVISGRRRTLVDPSGERKTVGYRLVKGGGTFVLPIKEHVQRLSLELMTLEVRTPEVYTVKGVRVTVNSGCGGPGESQG